MQRKWTNNGCHCLPACLMSCVNGHDVWRPNKLFLFTRVHFQHSVDIFGWQMQLIAVPVFVESVATLITFHGNDVKVNNHMASHPIVPASATRISELLQISQTTWPLSHNPLTRIPCPTFNPPLTRICSSDSALGLSEWVEFQAGCPQLHISLSYT